MAGMNFQYDEEGGTFYYFLVSFYALALIPFTLWVFRKEKDQDTKDKDKSICHCEPCQAKNRRLHASKPKQKVIQKVLYVVVIIAWIFFAWAVYRVAQIKTDHVEYDPYQLLGVDRGATDKEIRKKYRELTRTHHPDKGGDEELFRKIAKAYAALTDEESRKNWEEYGNPDGPGAMQFGIALPKWLVEGNTSIWVLMSYVLVFMVILPAVVGTWWYKSIKYSGDKILLPTTQLYFYFINKTPNMVFKRAFMILAASFEFWKRHNPEVVERPTDDDEVRQLMREVNSTYLNEKNREQPLCMPYSIKARALLLAHMQQIPLPANTLTLDLLNILEKCPVLINEMVQICAQLTAMSKSGQAAKPRLETIENIMKMSPLVVQGLWENSSPLLMLPHVAEQQLRHFNTKKRSIRNLRQFCSLSDEDRRFMLRHLEDQEYRNILNVLRDIPAVTMICDMKVLDDEDNSITANAIVTVLVTLKRESMIEKYGSGNIQTGDIPEVEEGEETKAEAGEEEPAEQEEKEEKKKPKVWEKNKKGKSKGGAKKKKTAAVPYIPKSKQTAVAATAASSGDEGAEKKANGDEDDSDHEESVPKDEEADQAETIGRSDSDAEQASDSEGEDNSPLPHLSMRDSCCADHGPGLDAMGLRSRVSTGHAGPRPEIKRRTKAEKQAAAEAQAANGDVKKAPGNDDDDWEEFEAESKKHAKLEATSLVSHSVHCPYFPSDKQEYWWLYLCDKKKSDLITVPVRVTNLVDSQEIDVKFPAPRKTGTYTYTMCLKSDSYLDMDLTQHLKFDVKEAKVIESHPQWEISDDEEEKPSGSELDGESEDDESEFEYDED